MTTDPQTITRAAKQMIETDQLLGTNAVPPSQSTTLATNPQSMNQTKPVNNYNPEKLKKLAELCDRHKRECPLVKTIPGYNNIVFGEGDPDARLMFIGEAPGADEDRTGRPFVGRAGQLLNKMIIAMGLSREEVYIANVLKMRPPNNATPTPEQVEQSAPFLAQQIEIIQPEVIVTLGAPSTKIVLQTREGISKLRGRFHKAAFPGLTTNIAVMPTYHPAYLLRNYSPDNRKKVWADLCAALTHLGLKPPKNTA